MARLTNRRIVGHVRLMLISIICELQRKNKECVTYRGIMYLWTMGYYGVHMTYRCMRHV